MTGWRQPGSTAWLVEQDLRQAALVLVRTRAGFGVLMLLAALFMGLHGAYAHVLQAAPGEAMLRSVVLAVAQALGNWMSLALLAGVTAWMALWASVNSLLGARDLDLWLTAPVTAQQVFTVRGLSLAVQVLLPLIFLLAPLAHVGLFTGHALWLLIYPALTGFVLLSVAVGMAVATLLLARLGLKRTRQGLLVLMALLSYSLLIPRVSEARLGAPLSLSALSPPLLLTVTLALLLTGAVAFHAAARLATHRVVQGTREGVLAGHNGREPGLRAVAATRFSSGLTWAVLSKEWRLLLREPGAWHRLWPLLFCGALGAQALRGTIPASVLPMLFGVLAVYVATALAGGWASRVFINEAAPALLACAPVRRSQLLASKLLAALLPAWLLSLPVVLFVLYRQATVAWWLLPCLMGGPLTAGCIGLCAAPGSCEQTDGGHDRVGLGKRVLATLSRNAFCLAWVALTFWLAIGAR